MRAAEASARRENVGGAFWGACMLKVEPRAWKDADMKSGSREYKIRRPGALDLPRIQFIQLLGSANEVAGWYQAGRRHTEGRRREEEREMMGNLRVFDLGAPGSEGGENAWDAGALKPGARGGNWVHGGNYELASNREPGVREIQEAGGRNGGGGGGR
ncbi:hypothetical protein DFH09DRAFT_1102527 [Mycena vulgaris]|nr:hypothetical protein DFH09DRAFT_1102527 [Mycena vulgaris]